LTYAQTMAAANESIDQVQDAFPSWAVFRSDAGSFYATRRGERLSFEEIGTGLQQTVCADDLQEFLSLLREQEARRTAT